MKILGLTRSATRLRFERLATVSALWLGLGSALSVASTGCVTVNVNFPESAVQRATDDYVRELYRAKGKGGTGTGGAKPADGAAPAGAKSSWNGFVWPELIASAHAADGVFKVDTDKALEIKTRLGGRVDEVIAQKRAGVLGETNDGLLVVKAPEKLKKLQTARVEKLVADENADRNGLYDEVRKANGLADGRLKDIQKSFARSFQAESPSGTWVQDSDGKWAQKP
jgi:uncharacterized protein YdbL (DUF1318 family)